MSDKKELKLLIDNSELDLLKKYIDSKKSLDYSLSAKLGDFTGSFNPLLYALLTNPKVADFLIKNLDDLTIKDLLSVYEEKKVDSFSHQTDFVKDVLFKHFTYEEKNQLSNMLMWYKNRDDDKYLLPETYVKRLLSFDDANGLYEFLDKNRNFFAESSTNYLKEAINEQAVFCFDIIKEHIKSVKLEQNQDKERRLKM